MDSDLALNICQQIRTAYHKSLEEARSLADSGQDYDSVTNLADELERSFTDLYRRFGPDTRWKSKIDWVMGLQIPIPPHPANPARVMHKANEGHFMRRCLPFDTQCRHARRDEDPLIIHQAEPEGRLYILSYIHTDGRLRLLGGLYGHDAKRPEYMIELENGLTVHSVPRESLLAPVTFSELGRVMAVEAIACLICEAQAELRTGGKSRA